MLPSKARRRERIREQPFPDGWRGLLAFGIPLYAKLPQRDRDELHGHIQVLVAEKHFEGAAGLDVSDRMRMTILSQAALLLLHRPTSYFSKLVSVVIYPGEYGVREKVEIDEGLVADITETRLGESWTTGTLILSWEDVKADLANDRNNVVLHEFAHQLDAESGTMNGAPILSDRDLRRRWAPAMSDGFERLVRAVERDEETFLDPYGVGDPSEFFAVVTEAFFLEPAKLQSEEPALYSVLRDYYRQDPATW